MKQRDINMKVSQIVISYSILDGAKRVLVTAPSVDIPTIVLGVNEDEFKAPMTIVSMACSTANALGPLIKVLHKGIGVNEAVVTSIHSLTRSQNIVDGVPIRQKRDWRRGRSAKNLIPTHSGLELSLSKILPEFSGYLFPFLEMFLTSIVKFQEWNIEFLSLMSLHLMLPLHLKKM